MNKKILKSISTFVLIVFALCSVMQTSPSYAEDNTGTIKIFSEIKGIEIFVDEISQGRDAAVLNNIQAGSHYIKATKDGMNIFSELVNVSANQIATVLIKDTGQVKEKILSSKYKEQQDYKSKKIDILLSKGMQTVGSGYTTSTYFPGYYSIFGSGWTSTSSTAYETTDWKIIQGGVQQISDVQFANIVNDTNALKRYQEEVDANSNKYNIGAGVSIVGLLALLGGAATTGDTQIGLLTLGLVGCVFGLGFMSSEIPYSKHYASPSEAAKMAYEYNQGIKSKLGLPADFEP